MQKPKGKKARLHGVNHRRIMGCKEESSVLRYTMQRLWWTTNKKKIILYIYIYIFAGICKQTLGEKAQAVRGAQEYLGEKAQVVRGSPGISVLVHFPYEPLHNTVVPSSPPLQIPLTWGHVLHKETLRDPTILICTQLSKLSFLPEHCSS